jgi:hypothetical protein
LEIDELLAPGQVEGLQGCESGQRLEIDEVSAPAQLKSLQEC